MTVKMLRKYLFLVVTAVALLAAGCSRLGIGGARPDTQIAGDVKSRIETDANVPDKQISINASKGVVTLSGSVSSDAARNAAANDAAQVEGVKTVVNNLEVNPAMAANAAPQSQPQQQPQAEASHTPLPRWEESRPSPRQPARKNSGGPSSGAGNSGNSGVTVTTGNNGNNSSGNNMEVSNQEPPPPPPPPTPAPVQPISVPAGTTLAIRLNEQLSSETSQVGDVFHGSISTPVSVGGQVVIPTTADVEGRVVDVKSAGRFKGQSDLVIELTRVMMNGKNYSIVTDRWTKNGSARGKATAAKVGGGAALGAIIGAIAGGGKGAAIGSAAGAGVGTGVAGATKGQQVVLKPETVLSFQLQTPVSVMPGASRQSMNSN